MREEQIILEQIAEVMNERSCREVEKKTGLHRNKIWRMAQGMPFTLDYNVIFALGRLGYHLELVENSIDAYRPGKLSHEKDT